MKESEHAVMNRIAIEWSKVGDRLWRINSGMGWVGTIVKQTAESIVLRHPRAFHGAPKGFSDLFGYKRILVTQDMVGSTLAVVAAVEVKRDANSKASIEQHKFLGFIHENGGHARIATSFEESR